MRFATTCFTRVSFCRHAHNTLHESTRKTDSHTQYVRAFAGESRKTVSTASLLAACSTHTRRHTQSLSRIAKQRGTRTDKNEPKRRLGDEHVRRPAACQTHTHKHQIRNTIESLDAYMHTIVTCQATRSTPHIFGTNVQHSRPAGAYSLVQILQS